MNFAGKLKKWLRKTYIYFATHIMMRVICAMLLILLLIMAIFQSFLQNQYFQYLERQTEQTENAVLFSATNVLNNMIYNSLRVGGEIAIDNELYELIQSALDEDTANRFQAQRELDNKLDNISHYSDHIAAIAVVSEKGLLYEFGRYWSRSGMPQFWVGENLTVLDDMYQGVLKKIESWQVGYYYVSTEPSLRETLPRMRLFHIAVPVLGKNNALESVNAVLVISFGFEEIVDVSSLTSHSEHAAIEGYITDEDDVIIFHEDEQYIGLPREEYVREEGVVELRRELEYFDWAANIAINNTELRNEVNRMFSRGMMAYAILSVILFVTWQVSLREILQPINTVKDAMEEIQRGHQEKIEIGGSHEIWQVAEQYNEMIDALSKQRELTESAYQEKMLSIEMRNEAEKKALESQIDAHFLCNTLNAINYNVLESGNDEVASMLKQLSNILQYTFSTRMEAVTLGQEIHWVQQYLSLQKYRLMDKFDYEIYFPEEYSEWPCCKLFLQPFAENAIVHGFEQIDSGGKIIITGKERLGRFVIKILDNGCGMPRETADAIHRYFQTKQDLKLLSKGGGIGICNVVTRMKMFFGEQFDVQLETKQGEGTCFTFWLPLLTGMEEEQQEAKDEYYDC